MNRKIVAALSVILLSFILTPSAQAQPSGEEIDRGIGRIIGCKGKVWVVRGKERILAEKNMRIYVGDEIETEPESSVGVRIELEANKNITFHLRANSQVKIEELSLLAELNGEIEVETEGEEVECTVNTARENIGTSGTHFLVTTREPGTIVDVLDGQVDLTRKGEVIGANIVRDYKALVPRDQSLTIISPRPLSLQAGLSAVLPGTGKIYARRDIKTSLVTKALSTAALVGFFVCWAKEKDASEARIRAYGDYKTEFRPDKVEEFYNRHRDNVDKANTYRELRIGIAAVYGLLSVYETVTTIRDGLAYRKMMKEIRGLEEELRSPKIGLEIRDDAILAKARWSFE